MPIHDWTRVEAGVFHDFRHSWVEELQRALNTRMLPPDYYAMTERVTVGFGPDVLTLQGFASGDAPEADGANGSWTPDGRPPGEGISPWPSRRSPPRGRPTWSSIDARRRASRSGTSAMIGWSP